MCNHTCCVLTPGGRVPATDPRLGREAFPEDPRGGSTADGIETRQGIPQEACTHAEGTRRGTPGSLQF